MLTDRQTDRLAGRQTEKMADRQAGRQAGRQTDRQSGEDRQTDRQTDAFTCPPAATLPVKLLLGCVIQYDAKSLSQTCSSCSHRWHSLLSLTCHFLSLNLTE